ncbi:MAG: bifunctional phosphopantothenoylcysteine decarboxylase/phosphopantothenate--cysteine ligase CoaBC [Frankiaceae bacterium]|jgi:phosphopantothenoylcysteine decarboxylase/phosphopantothenate--cysteine ligase|nr:bifunctional phosphopantothenoylcysteine decarboxylase/phosphopantothenate--cysteine ligase CoaBC [Frankiaceae bacterium]
MGEHGHDEAPQVVLGVAGGIAAYKAAELLRRLAESGCDVTVVPTESALRFVGAPTWEALSHHPVAADVWSGARDVAHVALGRRADLIVLAPATADLLARAAHGIADDLLTNTLLTARCPVLFAPAMHTEMWEHPATAANVATLRARGAVVLEPAVGRLAGADVGKGRLPDPEEIALLARALLVEPGLLPPDLVGRHVLVTAGGTREPIDPVRYLSNRSSGAQGYALASVAAARGARVTLVSSAIGLAPPAGAAVVAVETAAQMRDAVHAGVENPADPVDIVVMAAAVADFRPSGAAQFKIKKTAGEPDPIALIENPDILAELVARRAERGAGGPVIVGFAAETGDATGDFLALGRAKLARKGADLLVVNQVGGGKAFGTPDNAAVIISPDRPARDVPLGPKAVLAGAVWDEAVRRLGGPAAPASLS